MGKLTLLLYAALAVATFFFGTLAMVCDSLVKYHGPGLEEACTSFSRPWITWTNEITGNDRRYLLQSQHLLLGGQGRRSGQENHGKQDVQGDQRREKGVQSHHVHHSYDIGPSLWCLVNPLFITSLLIVASWHLQYQQPQISSVPKSIFAKYWLSWTAGDPKIKLVSIVMLLVPVLIIVLDGSAGVAARIHSQDPDLPYPWVLIVAAANPAGSAAIVALGFFMIPVARQSPLLAALGWSPIHALKLHIWAGRICFWCVTYHGLAYCVIYGFRGTQQGEQFLKAMLKALFPPMHCMRPRSIWYFKEKHQASDGECYGYLRNFTGLLSGLSLLILTITSLNYVRRHYYRFFYVSHVIFGTLMLVFAVVHFGFISLYLVPGLIYYFCTTSPVIIQSLASYFLDNGVELQESRILQDSNGCAELVFSQSVAASVLENRQAAPYVRICVPSISLLWHPFTVASTPHDTHSKLKVLFRKYGYFTSALHERLQKEGPPPIILVDGFYFGPDWAAQALRHDVVLIVTGGIGITPFLSMIQMMNTALNQQELPPEEDSTATTRRIDFHWSCRDMGLIRYICQSQFSNLVRNSEKTCTAREQPQQACQIRICIHYTGSSTSDDCTPILLSQDTSERTTTSSTSSLESFEDEENQQEDTLSYQSITVLPCRGDVVRRYECACGQPMETSKLSFHHLSNRAIAGSCLAFAASAIGGLLFHWYFYDTAIEQYPRGVYFRAYNLYVIFSWTLLVGLAFETTHRYFQHRGGNHHSILQQAEDVTEDQASLATTTTTPKASVTLALPFDGVTGPNTRLTVKVSRGRPDIHSVVAPVVEAQVPGAFFCGPEALLKSVQKEIRNGRTKKLGRLAPRCAIYQEEFEM